ncbi:YhdP family protein [Pseudomonas sp. F1_0610]|uniref:YhdP family protein n=1 Tax=Pseudomonas sp. F1_0610 TaxID=3114284 RepID=UPI0039C082D8
MKNLLTYISKISYLLIGAALILAALYVSIGRVVIPMAGEYSLELEQFLRERLKQEVKVERLEGQWHIFSPVFVAHNVHIGNADSGVHVQRLALKINLLSSLLGADLNIESILLDGADFQLVQQQGQWQLLGVSAPEESTNGTIDIQKLLNYLQSIKQLYLVNSRAVMMAEDALPLSLTYINLSLDNSAFKQQLKGRVNFADGEKLQLSLTGQLDTENWRNSRFSSYASLPKSQWSRFISPAQLQAIGIESVHAGVEVWYEQAGQNQGKGAIKFNADNIVLNNTGRSVELSHVNLTGFYRDKEQLRTLHISPLDFQLDGQKLAEPLNFLLSYQPKTATSEHGLQLISQHLVVDDLSYMLQKLAPLPEKGRDVIAILDAKGVIKDAKATWYFDREGKERLRYFIRPVQLNYQAWQGSPALTGINGTIEGDLLSGELNAQAEQPVSLHLDQLFPKPWVYDKGNVQFKWDVTDEGVHLQAPVIDMQGAIGQLQGNLDIKLYHAPDVKDTMDLTINIYNGDAAYTENYLPTRAPHFNKDTANWLTNAIKEGFVRQGYYKYKGHLVPEENDPSGSYLFFDVSNAVMDYQPGWPTISEAQAQVYISPGQVRVEHINGKILDTQVSDAHVQVSFADSLSQLTVYAPMLSNVNDILTILRSAPLPVNQEHFKDWDGAGIVPAQLDLKMPLDDPDKIKVKVAFQPRLISLQMQAYDLSLSQLRGDFIFDSDKGIAGKNVQGRFLHNDFTGQVLATGKNGKLASSIQVTGVMPVNSLQTWLGVKQPLPVKGKIPYQLRLNLDANRVQLQLNSSLQGMASELPLPFAKTAREVAPLALTFDLGNPSKTLKVNYKDQLLNGYFVAPNGDWAQLQGNVRLADGIAQRPTRAGIYAVGKMTDFDLGAWQEVLEQLQTDDLSQTSLLKELDVVIAKLKAFDRTFTDIFVQATAQPKGFNIALKSLDVVGDVKIRQKSPIDIKLASYHVSKDPARVTNDPLINTDPKTIPAFNLAIDKLYLADNSIISDISLKARPTKTGIKVTDLAVNLKGLLLSGAITWDGRAKKAKTQFSGTLSGANVGDILKRWGYVDSLTSEGFSVAITGNWPGSPQDFALENFSGVVDAKFSNGILKRVEGSAQALRIFGLLNFDSIGRRLRLDFRDIFGKGLAYDKAKLSLQAQYGVYTTRQATHISGPSSDLTLAGSINLHTQQINGRLGVTLPVSNNLSIAAIIAGAPAVGGAIFVVDKLIGDKLGRVATVNYSIKGNWDNPDIKPELLEKEKK